MYFNFDEITKTVDELNRNLEKTCNELNHLEVVRKLADKELENTRSKSAKEIAKLQDEIRKKDLLLAKMREDFSRDVLQLQHVIHKGDELLTTSRAESAKEIARLNEKIQSYEDNSKQVANLKNIIAELEKLNAEKSQEIVSLTTSASSSGKSLSELKTEIEKLKIEHARVQHKNDQLTKDYLSLKKLTTSEGSRKTSELTKKEVPQLNTRLKEDKESEQIMIYKENLKILETRLKHISAEFEKEIAKSTQLEIDKIKLQSLVDRMKLNSSMSIEPSTAKDNITNFTDASDSFVVENKYLDSLRLREDDQSYKCTSNSIIIQNYPDLELSFPLENTVEFIAHNINVMLYKCDILDANIVERNSSEGKVSLFVQFNSLDIKRKFLMNKHHLVKSKIYFLKSLWIKEYFDPKIEELYSYMKNELSASIFKEISYANNQIFVKLNRCDSKRIQIHTRRQLDALLKETGCSEEESSIDEASNFSGSLESLHMQQKSDDSTANSIIVQNYPKRCLKFPLENTIEHLAQNMHIPLDKCDILKVNIIGRNLSKFREDNICLFVQFKTRDIQSKFLAYRIDLSESIIPPFKAIRIKQYNSQHCRKVFLYAKHKLPDVGFKDIFLTNGKIFAKKNRADSRGIQIVSHQQVDELLRNPMLQSHQLEGYTDKDLEERDRKLSDE